MKGNVTPAGKDEPSAAQVLAEIAEYYKLASEEAKRNRVATIDLAGALGYDVSYIAKIARKLGIVPKKMAAKNFILKEEAKRIADHLAGLA